MLNLAAKPFKRFSAFQGSGLGVLLLGLTWRVILLSKNAFPFNADEAIVGLMGRHILMGERPIFFYGQSYMGSLDAFLVAIGFQLFGINVQVIRLLQIILYLGIILTTILIAYRLHKDQVAALLSGLLLAIPTVNFTLYTTVSLGGYGEALLIGNLLILLTLRLREAPDGFGKYLLWGVLAGGGFWAFGLTAIYIVPCALLVFVDPVRGKRSHNYGGYLALLIGLTVGLSPIINWIMRNGMSTFIQELFGSAIAGASSENSFDSFRNHFQNFLVFGPTVILGLRAPWSTEPLSLPLLPFAGVFWGFVMIHAVFRRRLKTGTTALSLLMGSSLILMIGFLLTPFGADPSGRYFLPLTIPLVILAGEFVRQPMISLPSSLRWVLFSGVIAFQLHTNWQTATMLPDRITTQFDSVARVDHEELDRLITFLTNQDETRGYTNYWVAYPLAFKSDEQLIFYPSLPYHKDFRYSARDNRYPAYEEAVDQSPHAAFITTHHVALDESLRNSLRSLGVNWDEIQIGDYRIFYNLSERVEIEEVGEVWLSQGS
jgi:4-amino-4-deoxy-L-arabinose transferase-like glycosyltransferase